MKVIAFIGVTLTFSLAYAAASWAACDTGRSYGDGYWFDGWYRTAASIPGGSLGYVGSQILEYSPYVAPTSGAESTSAWPMIWNDEASAYYSQVGWLKYATGQRRSFSEWVVTTNGVRQVLHAEYAAWPVGNWTLYEVYWDPNSQRLQHYINGNLVQSHIRYFTMRRADISGETHEYRSQMPGGANYHEQLANSYVANLGGGVYTFNGVLNITNGAIHGQAQGSSTRLDIWDKACST